MCRLWGLYGLVKTHYLYVYECEWETIKWAEYWVNDKIMMNKHVVEFI